MPDKVYSTSVSPAEWASATNNEASIFRYIKALNTNPKHKGTIKNKGTIIHKGSDHIY